jgi:protein-disulfide isomerase
MTDLTGIRLLHRLAFILLISLLVSAIAAACGGDDDDEPEATVTAVTDTAAEGEGDEPETTATSVDDVEPPVVTADPEATATDPIPTATASATPEGGLAPSLLVIPEARDESIPQNGRVLGDPDAPVTIVEYGDFQ